LKAARAKFDRGGWTANFVVGIIIVLVTPAIGVTLQRPKLAIISAAVGITAAVWIVAAVLLTSLRSSLSRPLVSDPSPTIVADSQGGHTEPPLLADTNAVTTAHLDSMAPKASKSAQTGRAVNQTMVNSPGGTQVGGDVVLPPERRLIYSLTLEIQIDAQTPPSAATDRQASAGLQSAVALFNARGDRFRFVTNYQFEEQQVDSGTKRLFLSYTPEVPSQLLGQPVAVLATMENLGFDYAEFLKISGFADSSRPMQMAFQLRLNGVEVVSQKTPILPAGQLTSGQLSLKVGAIFRKVPATYNAVVSKSGIR